MNRWYGLLLLALFLVQLAVPASMIAGREMTLRHGQAFRFRTAPVDPYDPFRGRFVALNLEAASAPLPKDGKLTYRQKVLVRLAVDEAGFAYCRDIVPEPPAEGAYLAARVQSWDKERVRLQLPFDRYYSEEELAPEIERAYRAHSRRGKQEAFIAVRVRDGRGVLEELYIDELPVGEYLRRQAVATEAEQGEASD
ncbi:MAG: GDYXXLXY domain-containing protein [Syntrophotaleaceae bacterium]